MGANRRLQATCCIRSSAVREASRCAQQRCCGLARSGGLLLDCPAAAQPSPGASAAAAETLERRAALGWWAPLPPPPPPHARASNRPALSLPSAPSAGGLPVQQWWILPPRRRRWRQSCPPASGPRPATTWRHGAKGGGCATLLRLAFCRHLQQQPACRLAGCTFQAASSVLAAACIPSCRYMDNSDADQRKPHRCGGQWLARGLACCTLMHA